MTRKLKIVIFFFMGCLIGACASSAKVSKDTPDWVNNTTKECTANEICAVGSGNSLSLSKTDARNNILRYFETTVSSQFKSKLSTNESTIESFTSEDLQELSSGILRGVNIKKTAQIESTYYSLAALDKNIAIKEIRSDIDKMDSQMKLMVSENNIKYKKELEKLYVKRENLNRKYLVLTGSMVPEAVKYEDIFNIKKTVNNLIYYIGFYSSAENEVANMLKKILLENDIKVVTDQKQANRLVNISLKVEDAFINVSGFVKQNYILDIEVNSPNGKTSSSINEEFEETGRDKNQIKKVANNKIRSYLEENIDILLQ